MLEDLMSKWGAKATVVVGVAIALAGDADAAIEVARLQANELVGVLLAAWGAMRDTLDNVGKNAS